MRSSLAQALIDASPKDAPPSAAERVLRAVFWRPRPLRKAAPIVRVVPPGAIEPRPLRR